MNYRTFSLLKKSCSNNILSFLIFLCIQNIVYRYLFLLFLCLLKELFANLLYPSSAKYLLFLFLTVSTFVVLSVWLMASSNFLQKFQACVCVRVKMSSHLPRDKRTSLFQSSVPLTLCFFVLICRLQDFPKCQPRTLKNKTKITLAKICTYIVCIQLNTIYRISSDSFLPWIVSSLEYFPHPNVETIPSFYYIKEKVMRKLFELFKVLTFQKRIVAAATIWGNTVFVIMKGFRSTSFRAVWVWPIFNDKATKKLGAYEAA